MLDWLGRNAEVLSLFASIGMLLIWLLYLQLFYTSYKLQQRPNLLIHQAAGFDLASLCMIANMSERNVHVAALLVDAERDGERVSFLPAPRSPDPIHDDDPIRMVHQGPLPQGGYFIVGQFRSLVAEADRRLPTGSEGADLRLTIRVVAFVGSQLFPAGARRTFDVREFGPRMEVRPSSTMPQQLSARRQREVVQEWLEEARAMDPEQVASYQEDEESVRRLTERLGERSEPT